MPLRFRPATRALAARTVPLAALLPFLATRTLDAQPAGSGWPGLTASFIAPTGTVQQRDDVPVWVRLTLTPTAQAITFDRAAGGPDFGLRAGFLPTTGRAVGTPFPQPFARYANAVTGAVFGCNGSSFGGPAAPDSQPVLCRAAAYRFVFNDGGALGGPSISGRSAFTLLPGESFDFLFGAFQVQNGAAPVGTYTFRGAAAQIELVGYDAQGRLTFGQALLASTCSSPTAPDCQTFRRDVVAAAVVPEPGPVALFGAGLLILGGAGVRRRPAESAGPE